MEKIRKLIPVTSGDKEKQVDRISMLADALIHHVMSFVHTMYAVQTSILSKRWIHIWKSLPVLNFGSYVNALNQSDRLTDFIDRVFILRDDSSIQWFRLRWLFVPINNGVRRSFSKWIDGSVALNVQEVTMQLHQHNNLTYEIPPRLLNYKSLKKLVLSMSLYTDIILTISMSLPQLKFMCLRGFLVSNVESAKRLFSSCPLLETLTIVNCDIQTDNQRNFNVEFLRLKEFSYSHLHSNHRWNHLRPKILKLSAPNLSSFTCESYLTQDYDLQNCSDQLSYANVNILYNNEFEKKQLLKEEKEEYAKRIVKLFRAVDKVNRLDLSSGFLEVLWRATNLLNCPLPWLCDLQFLGMETWFTRGSLRAVAYLLTISPNVKNLILKSNKQSNLAHIGDDWEVGLSAPGMLSDLKVVRIGNAERCDAELKILSFLFKNAKVLKEISVYPCSTIKSIGSLRKRYEEKLRILPRSSSGASMRWGETGNSCCI